MSADLERSVAEHAVVHEAVEPSVAQYTGIGILTFLITALEIFVANNAALAGVQRPIIITLLVTNFTVAALYYQGLQYENALNKMSFGIGVFLGVLVALSLPLLLSLGLTPGDVGIGN